MTALQSVAFGLYALSAAVAAINRCKLNRPVARYLAAVVLLEVLRLVVAQPPSDEPYAGWALIARSIDCGAYLAISLALPAMSVALFLKRSAWLVWAVHLALWIGLCLSYPAVRGEALLQIYAAVDFASIGVSVGCFIVWLRSARLLDEWPLAPFLSAQALIAAAASIALLPCLTGGTLLDGWQMAVAANAAVLACVLLFQVRSLSSSS